MEATKKSPKRIIAGILFALAAIILWRSDFAGIAQSILLLFVAVLLFIGTNKQPLLSIALGLPAVFCIWFFLMYDASVLSVSLVLYIAAFVLAAFFAFLVTSENKRSETIKKLWWIPGVVCLIGVLVRMCLVIPYAETFGDSLHVGSVEDLPIGLGLLFAMNWLASSGKSTRAHRDDPAAAPVSAPAVEGVDGLKKYKELLDCGAITQEEYDAKKKQLLGL